MWASDEAHGPRTYQFRGARQPPDAATGSPLSFAKYFVSRSQYSQSPHRNFFSRNAVVDGMCQQPPGHGTARPMCIVRAQGASVHVDMSLLPPLRVWIAHT